MPGFGAPRRRSLGELLNPAVRSPDRYLLVLGLLLVNYLVGVFPAGALGDASRLVVFVVTLVLAVRTSNVHRSVARWIAAVMFAGTAAVALLVAVGADSLGLGVLNAWMAVVLLVTVLVIVRRVLAHEVVTVNTIFGALSAYLLIGFTFAAIYGALVKLDPAPFFAGGQRASTDVLQYFSFTTLTTLGYGDFAAATQAGRSLAVFEALVGQIFLVTLVARLVSAFRPRAGGR
ncbi:potassium channel family protein [Saccharopolyspora griseoalba]|uniref:Potassium channel family protein n=1 Tax=Saccharopolyspora griseoalba TaxID=1431848 RepID=A0ABW2LKR9_9PSEU